MTVRRHSVKINYPLAFNSPTHWGVVQTEASDVEDKSVAMGVEAKIYEVPSDAQAVDRRWSRRLVSFSRAARALNSKSFFFVLAESNT